MIRIQNITTFINVKQKNLLYRGPHFFTEPIDDCEYFVTLNMYVTKKKHCIIICFASIKF